MSQSGFGSNKKKPRAKKQVKLPRKSSRKGNRRSFKSKDKSLFWKFLSLTLLLYIFFSHRTPQDSVLRDQTVSIEPARPAGSSESIGVTKKPVQPEPPGRLPEPSPGKTLKPQAVKGRVAIVIDDLGSSKKRVEKIFDLNIPVTMAILPDQKYTTTISRMVKKRGGEVLLHLPMEPKDPSLLQSDFIRVRMGKKTILKMLAKSISQIEGVVGLNNHMGSRATESRQVMEVVLSEVKKRKLFFLDSLTTAGSKGYKIAKKKGVRTARRDVFLDNKEDLAYIENQIEQLIAVAKKKKRAIGIGHPHLKTIEAIRMKKYRFKEEGLELVFLSELVE